MSAVVTAQNPAGNGRPSCLIIGAGPGIGQAVAMAFANEGYDIGLLARHREHLREHCEDIEQKTGRRALAVTADAADEASLQAGIETVRTTLGAPDVLVYNVASHAPGRPLSVSLEHVVANFKVNVVSALVAARAVAPAMIERKRGTILFTGGGFAYEPAADYSSLSMDKAALRSLTYTLAQELGMHGVHVATVTVYGFIQHGTHFDPTRIAHSYIRLHRQPKGHFETEAIYK